MNPIELEHRKREARRRLGAQRRRVGDLRYRVIALSLICFALLWAIVFVQMATGNDPVLGAGRHAAGASAVPRGKTSRPESESEAVEPEPAEVETIEPEPVEPEVIEPETVEPEVIEPEPVPVETAQS